MITIRVVGSFKESMERGVQDVCEALVGWKPFVNDEFTISDPEECPDGRWVVTITIGNLGEELAMVLNHDAMFLEKTDARQLIHVLDMKD